MLTGLLATPDTTSPGISLVVGLIAITIGVALLLFRRPLMGLYTRFGSSSSEARRTSAIVSAYVVPVSVILLGLVVVIGELIHLA